MNIITNKTRRKHKIKIVPQDKEGFKRQWESVRDNGENSQEYLREKRMHELSQKGYNEDHIHFMMHGTKGDSERGETKKILNRIGKIKLDGRI